LPHLVVHLREPEASWSAETGLPAPDDGRRQELDPTRLKSNVSCERSAEQQRPLRSVSRLIPSCAGQATGGSSPRCRARMRWTRPRMPPRIAGRSRGLGLTLTLRLSEVRYEDHEIPCRDRPRWARNPDWRSLPGSGAQVWRLARAQVAGGSPAGLRHPRKRDDLAGTVTTAVMLGETPGRDMRRLPPDVSMVPRDEESSALPRLPSRMFAASDALQRGKDFRTVRKVHRPPTLYAWQQFTSPDCVGPECREDKSRSAP
jgi:hypothetical protein